MFTFDSSSSFYDSDEILTRWTKSMILNSSLASFKIASDPVDVNTHVAAKVRHNLGADRSQDKTN